MRWSKKSRPEIKLFSKDGEDISSICPVRDSKNLERSEKDKNIISDRRSKSRSKGKRDLDDERKIEKSKRKSSERHDYKEKSSRRKSKKKKMKKERSSSRNRNMLGDKKTELSTESQRRVSTKRQTKIHNPDKIQNKLLEKYKVYQQKAINDSQYLKATARKHSKKSSKSRDVQINVKKLKSTDQYDQQQTRSTTRDRDQNHKIRKSCDITSKTSRKNKLQIPTGIKPLYQKPPSGNFSKDKGNSSVPIKRSRNSVNREPLRSSSISHDKQSLSKQSKRTDFSDTGKKKIESSKKRSKSSNEARSKKKEPRLPTGVKAVKSKIPLENYFKNSPADRKYFEKPKKKKTKIVQ